MALRRARDRAFAGLYATYARTKIEHKSRRVELVMDYADFTTLARSYNYDTAQFLIALRKVGLTSVAVPEELGGQINGGSNAIAYSGQQLTNAARLSPFSESGLAAIVKRGVAVNAMYLIVYDPATFARYKRQLPLRFERKSIAIVRGDRAPYVIQVKTTPDFFATVGPRDSRRSGESGAEARALPRATHPRRRTLYGTADRCDPGRRRDAPAREHRDLLRAAERSPRLTRTRLDATAAALVKNKLNFGTIETYDKNQTQKGNDELAKLVIDRTARVQAISKPELDKYGPDGPREIVARYLLGIRERNVRVVYLRPWTRPWGTRSIEAANVEMVRQIAAGMEQSGFKPGRATPIPGFTLNPVVVALTALAVPALVLLVLEGFGIRDRRIALGLFAVTLLFYGGAYAVHHDALARKTDRARGRDPLPDGRDARDRAPLPHVGDPRLRRRGDRGRADARDRARGRARRRVRRDRARLHAAHDGRDRPLHGREGRPVPPRRCSCSCSTSSPTASTRRSRTCARRSARPCAWSRSPRS